MDIDIIFQISCVSFYIIFQKYEGVPVTRAARATSGTRAAGWLLGLYSVE
jgi:hypothetical protein